MPKQQYIVCGANRDTAEDESVTVTAESPEQAENWAVKHGILVNSVEAAAQPLTEAQMARAVQEGTERSHADAAIWLFTTLGCIAFCPAAIVLIPLAFWLQHLNHKGESRK
jgi:hypothetical protein